jgi:hypothetical protein
VRVGARDGEILLCLHGVKWEKETAAASLLPRPSIKLLADFGTVFFRKILVAERAMKVHSRTEHMRIDNEYFFARWTSDFYCLAHDSSSILS